MRVRDRRFDFQRLDRWWCSKNQHCGQTDWKAAALFGVGKITVTLSAVCLVNRKARRQEHINDAKTRSAIEIAAV